MCFQNLSVLGFVRRLWEYILDKEDKNMMLDIGKVKKIGLFASGVLFGTAGVKVLGSKDAKKFYINCLAAGLRAKDCVMTVSYTHLQVVFVKLPVPFRKDTIYTITPAAWKSINRALWCPALTDAMIL